MESTSNLHNNVTVCTPDLQALQMEEPSKKCIKNEVNVLSHGFPTSKYEVTPCMENATNETNIIESLFYEISAYDSIVVIDDEKY